MQSDLVSAMRNHDYSEKNRVNDNTKHKVCKKPIRKRLSSKLKEIKRERERESNNTSHTVVCSN